MALMLLSLMACSRAKSTPTGPADLYGLGQSWTLRHTGGDTTLRDITWVRDQYASVGDSGIMLTSRDGEAWTKRTLPTNLALSAVVWDHTGNRMVVLNDSYEEPGWVNVSADGSQWESFSTLLPNVLAAAYDPGGLAAVGNDWARTTDEAMFSADGTTWVARTLGPYTKLNALVYTGALYKTGSTTETASLYVAVGGSVRTSADGKVWTLENAGAARMLNSVDYGAYQVMAVGDSGTVITSKDGKTWTSRSSGQTANLYGVVYTGTTWVAVGEKGVIVTSADGVAWTRRESGTTRTLRSVGGNGTTLAAVGDMGTVVTSP